MHYYGLEVATVVRRIKRLVSTRQARVMCSTRWIYILNFSGDILRNRANCDRSGQVLKRFRGARRPRGYLSLEVALVGKPITAKNYKDINAAAVIRSIKLNSNSEVIWLFNFSCRSTATAPVKCSKDIGMSDGCAAAFSAKCQMICFNTLA